METYDMVAATSEPIELSRFIEQRGKELSRLESRAFGDYEPDMLGGEDEVADLFRDKVFPGLNWAAARRGDTPLKRRGVENKHAKPDIWVFPKGRTARAYVVLEAIERRAKDSSFEERRSRSYEEVSESGLWLVSNGARVDVYTGSLLYVRLKLDRPRDRLLFASVLHPDGPVLRQVARLREYVDLSSEVESYVAKVVAEVLKKNELYRTAIVSAMVQGFLEHAGHLETTFVDDIATSDKANAERLFHKLLRDKTGTPTLNNLKARCEDKLHELKDIGLLLTRLLKFGKKTINFRTLDSYSFSRMYEHIFSREDRRKHGIYATPRSACRELTQLAYAALTRNEPINAVNDPIRFIIADVACGAGNFCEAAVEMLFEHVRYGNDTRGIERRNSRYHFEIRGQDVNAEAVTFAEASTIVAFQRRIGHAAYIANPLTITTRFSIGDSTNTLSDVYSFQADRLLLLGNPPFVKQLKAAETVISERTAKKNLGTILLETMVAKAKSKRTSIGVVLQSALLNNSSNTLQDTIAKKKMHICDFIDFGMSHLFTATGRQNWMGLVWTNTPGHLGVQIRVIPVTSGKTLKEIDDELAQNLDTAIRSELTQVPSVNDSKSFNLAGSANRELADLLFRLREEKLTVAQGITPNHEFVDGNKPCFQVPQGYFSAASLNKLERNFVKKYWTAGWCGGFKLDWNEQYIIDIDKRRYKSGKIWDEKLLRDECPTLYEHLLPCKAILQQKVDAKTKSPPWFSLHRNRRGSIYPQDKLVVPQMLNWKYPVLAFIDAEGIGVPSNFNVIRRQDGYRKDWKESLAGWFNSGVIKYYLIKLGSKPRGQGEITGKLLKEVPVPSCIVRLSDDRNLERNNIDKVCTEIIIYLAGTNDIVDQTIYRDEVRAS